MPKNYSADFISVFEKCIFSAFLNRPLFMKTRVSRKGLFHKVNNKKLPAKKRWRDSQTLSFEEFFKSEI